jgi:hypothetical protein
VTHEQLRIFPAEIRSKPLDQIHGAVLPAGAADRDCQVTAIRGFIVRQAALEKPREVFRHLVHARARLEKLDHSAVLAGELLQRGFPVGIRQRAGIEHEIRVAGHAVLVAERLEKDRQPAGAGIDTLSDQRAQFVNAHP